jgi:hypothetical protein
MFDMVHLLFKSHNAKAVPVQRVDGGPICSGGDALQRAQRLQSEREGVHGLRA